MNKRLMAVLVIAVFALSVLAGCGGDSGGGSTDTTKYWTYMVYMDGDNDLETAAWVDFFEMQKIGSTDNVNIIVQWDNLGTVDWKGCRRYFINKSASTNTIDATLIEDMGNVNMGDPNTLVNFVKWGISNYKANHYAVVLWDHGNGWKKRAAGSDVSFKGICWDETSGDDYLTTPELRQAFSEITAYKGSKIDVIGMDACLMGMVEVAYELRNECNYFVFSETSEPNQGWPHDTILADLTATPSMTPATFSQTVVQKYGQYYEQQSASFTTMMAADASKIDALAASINVFAGYAMTNMTPALKTALNSVRTSAKYVDDSFTDQVDLVSFCNGVVSSNSVAIDATLKAHATSIIAAHEASKLAFWQKQSGFNGMAIWIPDSTYYNFYKVRYGELQFTLNTDWSNFLNVLHN